MNPLSRNLISEVWCDCRAMQQSPSFAGVIMFFFVLL